MMSFEVSVLMLFAALLSVGYASREPYPLVITSDHQGNSPYSFHLRWQEPSDGGSEINQYIFKTRKVDVRPGTWELSRELTDWTFIKMKTIEGRPMTSTTLDGLDPNTYYEVHATMRNDIGVSEPSSFIFVTAFGPDRASSSEKLMGSLTVLLVTSISSLVIMRA